MHIEQIQHRVSQAGNLHISAGETQRTEAISSKILDMSLYAGLIEYRPEELVITVKAGTPIQTIKQTLYQHGQALPFFADESSTIGAAYAMGSPNLSDAILGIKIIDGQARILTFGGQVMKNVAGYDVSRLLVGSKGHLAVICEISFKVLPIAYVSLTKNSQPSISHASPSAKSKIEQGLKNIFDPNNIFI